MNHRNQFKLGEPWDSPNNKRIAQMPKIYASPQVEAKPGETVYKVFVGKEAMSEMRKGKRFVQITVGNAERKFQSIPATPVERAIPGKPVTPPPVKK